MFTSTRSVFLADAVPVVVTPMVMTWPIAIALLFFLSARPAAAQAAAEYGHIAAGTSASTAAVGRKLDSVSNKLSSALSQSNQKSSAPDVSTRAAVTTDSEQNPSDANRRALEQTAGQHAATLSLKSLPVKARVQINGKPVGKTPLQLSLAPGSYQVEMCGPRMEAGKQQLNLSPKETRENELQLSAAPRYPKYVELE